MHDPNVNHAEQPLMPGATIELRSTIEDEGKRAGQIEIDICPGIFLAFFHFTWEGWDAPKARVEISKPDKQLYFSCVVGDAASIDRLTGYQKQLFQGLLHLYHARAGHITELPERGPIPLTLLPYHKSRSCMN